MTPKTTKIVYWTITVLFLIAMLMDGIAGVAQEKTGQEVMRHLGYPLDVMIILGIAKIAGVTAMLQTKYTTIKEWAFAGFTINFLGAFASRALVGDGFGLQVPPLIMLACMFFVYGMWKRYQQIKTA